MEPPPVAAAVGMALPFRSTCSGGLSMVVLQHPAQPRSALDRGTGLDGQLLWEDQLVVKPLVVTLSMIMRQKLNARPAERSFPEQDHAI